MKQQYSISSSSRQIDVPVEESDYKEKKSKRLLRLRELDSEREVGTSRDRRRLNLGTPMASILREGFRAQVFFFFFYPVQRGIPRLDIVAGRGLELRPRKLNSVDRFYRPTW